MVRLLTGLHQGKWLSASSRRVIIDAMERCRTGTRRIPALLPAGVTVAHKTGSLNNTSSDVGILTAPDGRSIAVAIYVTGQGSRANREAKIASIARAIYDGYAQDYQRRQARSWTDARHAETGG
jgi:beta-lactamase class A